MPNSNVTIDQLESLGINDSIDSLDKLIIYDIDENVKEPTKSVTFEKFTSSLAIPTYDLASTNSNGLIKQIRTDVPGQGLVYGKDKSSDNVGWYSISNNNFRANTSYGGTICPLDGNSLSFLNGNGNFTSLKDPVFNFLNLAEERLIFNGGTESALRFNCTSATNKATRLVIYGQAGNTGLGLLSINPTSIGVNISTYEIAGRSVFNNFTMTTHVYQNSSSQDIPGEYYIRVRKVTTSGRDSYTMIGFDGNTSLFTPPNNYTPTGDVSFTNISIGQNWSHGDV